MIHASDVRFLGTVTRKDVAANRRVGFDVLGGIVAVFEPGPTAAADVVPDRVWVERTNSRAVVISGATNVTIKGANIGPGVSCSYGDTCADDLNGGYHQEDLVVVQARRSVDGTPRLSTGTAILDSYLHDLTHAPADQYPSSAGTHADCIQLFSWHNVRIQNNRFWNCPDTNVFAGFADGTLYENLRVENNDFGAVGSYSYWSSQFGCTSLRFRRNIVRVQDVVFGCAERSGAVTIEENVMPSVPYRGCEGVTRRFNFYTSPNTKPCDPATEAFDRPRVLFLESAYLGHSVRVTLRVLAPQRLRLRIQLYRNRRLVLDRRRVASVGTRTGAFTFRWRDASKRPATRICVRTYHASGTAGPRACARIAR